MHSESGYVAAALRLIDALPTHDQLAALAPVFPPGCGSSPEK